MRPIAVSAVLGLLLLASPAAAQDEELAGGGDPPPPEGGTCGLFDGCTGGHLFYIWWSGTKTRIHNPECKYCWNGTSEVPKEQCHQEDCGPGLDDLDRLMYGMLQRAAKQGDLRTVLTLGLQLPGKVEYNHARRALQLRSCGGGLIANLPLHPAFVASARTMLRFLAIDAASRSLFNLRNVLALRDPQEAASARAPWATAP